MNKIIVVDDKIEKANISSKIKFNIETFEGFFAITNIEIEFLKNTDLIFEIEETGKKAKINVTLQKNCCATIYIYEKNNDSKLQYKFVLGENSNLTVKKLKHGLGGKEMLETTFTEINSCLNYYLKSFCRKKEVYDYYIYHNAPQTYSSITNDIVTYEKGNVQLQTSLFVPKGSEKCSVIINNKIINLNNKKNEIRPNFYIDQYDATINHSALVGPQIEPFKNILLYNINNKNMEKRIINIIEEEGGELYQ